MLKANNSRKMSNRVANAVGDNVVSPVAEKFVKPAAKTVSESVLEPASKTVSDKVVPQVTKVTGKVYTGNQITISF